MIVACGTVTATGFEVMLGAEAFGVTIFGAGSWNFTMSNSTDALVRANCVREASMISVTNVVAGWAIGGRVVAENGAEVSPSIMSFK